MQINTIAEAETALLPYVPLVAQLTGKDTVLDRILPLMDLLGNPEQQLKVVHIAGTSGKTSTAYYMAALLQATGKKIGLTVSPHVDSVSERVQINGQPLPEALFCALLTEFLQIVERTIQPPTYFELLYAFALWVFARERVDYAVVETGMGGLYDATNVVTRPNKVCVITDIGFDHMHILGNSLPEIAAQKIGIVHEHNQVFTYQQAPEIMDVFSQWSKQHKATLHIVSESQQYQENRNILGKIPVFQWHNWLLAHSAFNFLKQRDKLLDLTRQALIDTQFTTIPARMEIVQLKNKQIIMDGAHNQQKMTAFLTSFRQQYPYEKPTILIALKQGKEYKPLVPLIAKYAQQVIVTKFETTQDLPVKSMDPNILVEALRAIHVDAKAIPNQEDAVQALLNTSTRIVIITGSFYLLSQLRAKKLLT